MSGLVSTGEFVAFIPALARALGSPKAALIVQHVHFRANGEPTVRLTYDGIAEGIGCSKRTVATYVPMLVEQGILERERTSTQDAAWTYRINHEHPLLGGRKSCTVDDASSASSDDASSASSSTQKVEEVGTGGGRASGRGVSRTIPTDWQPSPETVTEVRSRWPKVDHRRSHERFVNHHRMKGTRATDWDAGFVMWVQADDERRIESEPPEEAVRYDDVTGMPINPKPMEFAPSATSLK